MCSTRPPYKAQDSKKSVRRVEIPRTITDSALWAKMASFAFAYSLAGLILGSLFLCGGIFLCAAGVGGSVTWITKGLGLESGLWDATPGVILFVAGLFVVRATRFSAKTGP